MSDPTLAQRKDFIRDALGNMIKAVDLLDYQTVEIFREELVYALKRIVERVPGLGPIDAGG